MSPFGAGVDRIEVPRWAGTDMTVCIGAICNQKRSPSAIMLGMDIRISYTRNGTVVGKHDLTSKWFQLPFGFSGAIAGTVPDCERFISYLWEYMTQACSDPSTLQLDHIVIAARNANEKIVLSMFDAALVNKLGMTRNEWIDRQSDQVLKMEGRQLLHRINPDSSCLIAGFAQGHPVLLRIVGKNPPEEIPSHSAIGIGAAFAMEKLSARTQSPYCSIQRSGLAFTEALCNARRKSGGFVGPPAHCVVLQPGIARQFDTESEVLRKWGKTVKNKDTHMLDGDEYWEEFRKILIDIPRPSKQSDSQTLEQAQ